MAQSRSIIDTDIHSSSSRTALLDFLPEPWRTRYASGEPGPGHLGYWNPNGVMRADAVTPDGQRIETRPDAPGDALLRRLRHRVRDPQPRAESALRPLARAGLFRARWSARDQRHDRRRLAAGRPALARLARSSRRPIRSWRRERSTASATIPAFVQVLMASGARMPYGQRFYHPIYEAAAEHDLPVAIHPGTEGVGISGPPTAAGYPTQLPRMAHRPGRQLHGAPDQPGQRRASSAKFPTLKLRPARRGRLLAAAAAVALRQELEGAPRQTTPWLERPPAEYITDHVLLSTQPIEEPEERGHLRAILDMFPSSTMLMFSSDFPHWDGDTPDFAARAFAPAVRDRVMSETARALYKLPAASSAAEVHAEAAR